MYFVHRARRSSVSLGGVDNETTWGGHNLSSRCCGGTGGGRKSFEEGVHGENGGSNIDRGQTTRLVLDTLGTRFPLV